MGLKLVWAALCASHAVAQNGPKVSQYSLAPPFVADDNTRWETGAGAKVEDDFVRLTPDFPSRTGYLWSRQANTQMTDWEVVIEFKVSGHPKGGGEGFAFWYTDKRMLGPVFGSSDYWNGLGLFFDSHNNDRKGKSPLVVAVYNDGTMPYSAHDDGVRQSIGNCHAPYLRNRNQNSFARITYKNQVLTVELAFDSSGGQPNYQACISAPLILGPDKFMGLTAHTGHPIVTKPPSPQISDNHDIYQITTYDLSPGSAQADLKKRREDYRREVQEKHSQMPNHQDIDAHTFKHHVVALLGQLEGAVQLLDQSQMNIQSMLVSSHETDVARDVKIQDDAKQSKEKAAQDSKGIRDIIDQIIDQQTKLEGLVGSGGNDGPDARTAQVFQDWQSSYARMYEEVKALRRTLDEGGNTRNNQNNDQGARNVLTEDLQNFRKQQDTKFNELRRKISDLAGSTEDLGNQFYRADQDSSGEGLGWFPTILLAILLVEAIAMVYFQFKGVGFTSSSARDKFV